MPVRIRITVIFSSLVFMILVLVCGSVYYFSYSARIENINTRLLNRAKTIATLLSQSELFSNELLQRIDSATSLSLTNKVIYAFDYKNSKIYDFTNVPGDTVRVDKELLNEARIQGEIYFRSGKKEAVAYHYTGANARMVMVAAGEDIEGRQTLKRLGNILLLSCLGGMLIAVAGGYIFSKGLLKPIKKIADDVNDISAQNLSRRINAGKVKDELYYLSDTLNSLLNRLQESFDLQKRFIANASHELSTPLTSISSQIEVWLQRQRSAEDYRKVLQSIQSDVVHMSTLTQTLLQFAKASGTAGGLEIKLVRIDEVILRMPAEALKLQKGYTVLLEFDELPAEEENLLVYGNESLLFSAIKNLVSNACKYSDDHVAIVRLGISTGEIVIQVKDNGHGIPKEELEHIYQPFYRVNENIVHEGFGLGLSLASRIIKLHKGEIHAESEVGVGTTFTITLPQSYRFNEI